MGARLNTFVGRGSCNELNRTVRPKFSATAIRSHLINRPCGSRLQPRHQNTNKNWALAPEGQITGRMGVYETSSSCLSLGSPLRSKPTKSLEFPAAPKFALHPHSLPPHRSHT